VLFDPKMKPKNVVVYSHVLPKNPNKFYVHLIHSLGHYDTGLNKFIITAVD
jgi:hypothetical protein